MSQPYASQTALMTMISPPQMLQLLKDARTEQRPWWEVAFALSELERTGPVDETGRPWLQRAERESGYAANQLRRMTRLAQFRDHLIQTEPVLAERLLSRPFSHVETIARIWKLDQQEARELIEGKSPNATYRDLYDIYVRVSHGAGGSAPVVAGKRAAKDFREKAIALIKADPKLICDDPQLAFDISRPLVPFRYSNPDYFCVGRNKGKVARIDAIDCYALHDGSQKDVALRKMITVATEATCFTRFWIVVPDSPSADIILRECGRLDLPNVGVVLLSNNKLLWERIPAADAKPHPDRRHLWSEFDKSRLRPPR